MWPYNDPVLDIRRVARVLESRALVALTTSIAVHAVTIGLLVTVVTFVRPASHDPALVIDLPPWAPPETPERTPPAGIGKPVVPRRSAPAPRPERRAPARLAGPVVAAAEHPPIPPEPVLEDNEVPAGTPAGDQPTDADTIASEEAIANEPSTGAPGEPSTTARAEAEPPAPADIAVTELAGTEPSAPAVPDVLIAEPTPQPAVPEMRAPDIGTLKQDASVSARAEGQPFRTRREVLEYLLDHPEFTTHLTRMLRIARYRVWETADGLFLDDGWGATVKFSVNAAEGGLRVIHASGHYDPGLLPTIRGELVVLLAPTFTPDPDGRQVVSLAVTTFVKFRSPVVKMVAKIAHAAVVSKAEREARTLARVIAKLSRAIEEDPAGLYQRLSERPEVPRRELLEFAALLGLR